MGSEDLFKKRKAKRLSDYQRKKAYRQPYERILIVCEGEKTEPFYFNMTLSIRLLSSLHYSVRLKQRRTIRLIK